MEYEFDVEKTLKQLFEAEWALPLEERKNVQEYWDGYEELKMARKDLESAVSRVEDRCEMVRRRLTRKVNPVLNSLGELQSRGPAFDVAVVVYQKAYTRWEKWLLKK